MKKVLYLTTACLMLSACGNFNDKQPIDTTYYKKTQSVAWPEQKSPTATKAKTQVKKAADKTAGTTTQVANTATTVFKTITTTTTTSETTTYTK